MSTSEQRKAENQKYIKETVDVHINQLLLDILIEKPDDVVSRANWQLKYMAEWVYLKQNPDFKKNLKKELRQAAHSVEKEEGKAQHYEPKFTPSHVHSAVPEQELAKHHKKHSEKHEEDEDEEVPEEAEEEAEVFPFDCQDGYEKPHLNSDEEDEDEEADEVADLDTMLKQKQSQMASSGGVVKVRSSVSAEAFGVFNKKADFKARVIPKTPEQKEKIKAKLMNSFMFKALDEKDFETCIMAMEIKTYK